MFPAWVWVLVFGGIAVVGALVLALVLRSLWRKVTALLEELDVLAGRAGELADLAGRIEIPDRMLGADPYADGFDVDSDLTGDAHARPVRRT